MLHLHARAALRLFEETFAAEPTPGQKTAADRLSEFLTSMSQAKALIAEFEGEAMRD